MRRVNEWRDVPGYEDRYSVSDCGEIYSKRFNRLLKPVIDRYGYLKIALTKEGHTKYTTVHRIVAQTFIPNPQNKSTVNHKNEVKTDNRVCNLEWMTHGENDNYGSRNKRMSMTKSLTPVIGTDADGKQHYYRGVKDAWRQTGIYWSQISRACKGLTERTSNGFSWRYANGNESEMGRFTR